MPAGHVFYFEFDHFYLSCAVCENCTINLATVGRSSPGFYGRASDFTARRIPSATSTPSGKHFRAACVSLMEYPCYQQAFIVPSARSHGECGGASERGRVNQ